MAHPAAGRPLGDAGGVRRRVGRRGRREPLLHAGSSAATSGPGCRPPASGLVTMAQRRPGRGRAARGRAQALLDEVGGAVRLLRPGTRAAAAAVPHELLARPGRPHRAGDRRRPGADDRRLRRAGRRRSTRETVRPRRWSQARRRRRRRSRAWAEGDAPEAGSAPRTGRRRPPRRDRTPACVISTPIRTIPTHAPGARSSPDSVPVGAPRVRRSAQVRARRAPTARLNDPDLTEAQSRDPARPARHPCPRERRPRGLPRDHDRRPAGRQPGGHRAQRGRGGRRGGHHGRRRGLRGLGRHAAGRARRAAARHGRRARRPGRRGRRAQHPRDRQAGRRRPRRRGRRGRDAAPVRRARPAAPHPQPARGRRRRRLHPARAARRRRRPHPVERPRRGRRRPRRRGARDGQHRHPQAQRTLPARRARCSARSGPRPCPRAS